MIIRACLFALSLLGLAACGGEDKAQPPLPELNTQLSTKPLKKAEGDEFVIYLKNGIYQNTLNQTRYAEMDDAVAAPVAEGDFSQTNTQEAGVDEADRVKYDGDIMYVAANAYGNFVFDSVQPPASHVRVMQRQSDQSLLELAKLFVDEESTTIQGLYLDSQADRLAVMSQQYYWYSDVQFDIWRPYSQSFGLSVYDVSSPALPSQTADIKVDGRVLSSRLIGNTLYVVSSYSPMLENINYFPATEDDKRSNYEVIQQTTVTDLLPTYTDADGATQPLVAADACYLPEDATDKDGYDSIVTLTAINLSDPAQMDSICVNSQVKGIYASTSSLYLFGGNWQTSFVHQFNLDGLEYVASGELPGHFGWQNPNLRFSAYNGDLRVVTTERTDAQEDRLDHTLSVLRPTESGTFELVGQLPNQTRSSELGKPNEDIYAVRFFGNKAYVVTFERIDPFYVLDLTNPADPFVAGEVEITGFSSYLQPVTENLIFAIGQEVDPNRFLIEPMLIEPADAPLQTEEPEEGMKVALFDVSDPANPVEVGKKIFANGYSAAEYNYHALTYLPPTEQRAEHRFALPVQSWGSVQTGANEFVWSTTTELALFEVAPEEAEPLIFKGSVMPEQNAQNYYIGSWEDRAVLHSDVIYYLHGNQVWQSDWQQPVLVNGPY